MKSGKELPLTALREGIELPGLQREIKQAKINLYAEASRDFNPIHIDEAFARKTPLGGTIAHGMLILAYISQMMTAAFGKNWLTGGRLNVRFKAPARPGDVITVSGRITRVEPDEGYTLCRCEVLCENQDGETVISGDAKVTVKDDENSR